MRAVRGAAAFEGTADEMEGQLIMLLSKNMTRVMDLFRQWDANDDGQISKKEFKRGMATLGFSVGGEEVEKLFEQMDPDGSGTIDFRELEEALRQAKHRLATDDFDSKVRPSPPRPSQPHRLCHGRHAR